MKYRGASGGRPRVPHKLPGAVDPWLKTSKPFLHLHARERMKMRSELAWLGPRSAPHRGFRGCGLWVVGCGWRKPWPSVFGAGNLVLVCEVYEVNLLRTLQAVFPSRPNLEPAAEPAGGVAPPLDSGHRGTSDNTDAPRRQGFRGRRPASAPRLGTPGTPRVHHPCASRAEGSPLRRWGTCYYRYHRASGGIFCRSSRGR